MTAHQQRNNRRPYTFGFDYKVFEGQVKWQARVNDGTRERDLEGTFKVSTMGPSETFENRVVAEIHRAVDALEN